ncbi:MAG: beta-lactamase family protein [Cytophagaceae bacterium]|nr:beta-lactamase family protein [Gemmatimonadaceae bacterium]
MRSALVAALVLATPHLALSAQLPPTAQATLGTAPVATAPTRGPRDAKEVEAFVDGLLAAWMADKHIAGVTVSVVKDGQVLFAKGYGWADVAKRVPVDPAKTLFRIGSITKLFTWTSVMQLHEQGKLDLAKDVNDYIDFKIPATYPQPITLRDILTHTPGLEEDPRDLFTEDSAHVSSMSKWLPAHMPARVRPPFTFSSYSNWATGLAGYIVERQGGEKTFDDYVEKHVLQPLGMTQTTTRQPLPAQFANDMSVGYEFKNGEFVPHKFEMVTGAAPAGSMGASATDMAKFMIAHLNGGAYGDSRILGEKEAALMHSRLQGHDPRIPGFAHGFYEQSSHGLRLIGHGGDTQWFHSALALIPSEKVGVFMSTNTNTGSAISFLPFLDAFLDHYYPEAPFTTKPSEADKTGAKRYEGEYVFNRMNFTTWVKAVALSGSIPIAAMPDGTLLARTPFGAMRFVRTDSLLWREVEGGLTLAFRADDNGEITHAFMDATPMMVMDKMPTLLKPSLHQVILGGAIAMFVLIVLTAVIRFFIRNAPGRPLLETSVTRGRLALTLAALCIVVFLGLFASLAGNQSALLGDEPSLLKLALAFPVIALLLTLWAAWLALAQWRTGDGTFWMRLRHTGAVVVALVFFWSLNTWNLLGWRM